MRKISAGRLHMLFGTTLVVLALITSQGFADEASHETGSPVDCDENDRTFVQHFDYVPEDEVRGAPATPEAGLNKFLRGGFGPYGAEDFQQGRRDSSRAEFVNKRANGVRAAVLVEHYGDGWLVMAAAACDSDLKGARR